MGLLGDFTKGFVIFTGLLWVLAILGSVATGQTAIAVLLLVVLMIPVSLIVAERLRNRKPKVKQIRGKITILFMISPLSRITSDFSNYHNIEMH